MLRSRFVALIGAAVIVAAIGGATAFAGTKAGAVQVTSSSSCSSPLLQDNKFSGEIFLFMHDPNGADYRGTVTYQKTKTVVDFTLNDPICHFDGWYLYDTGVTTTEGGATSVAVFDISNTKVGGDSFFSTF
jgi:hypothetical protein